MDVALLLGGVLESGAVRAIWRVLASWQSVRAARERLMAMYRCVVGEVRWFGGDKVWMSISESACLSKL